MNSTHNTEGINSSEKVKKRIEDNLILQITKELYTYKGSHRMQIFITHGYLEMLMNVLIRNKSKNKNKYKRHSYGIKIMILNEIGVLSDQDYLVYDWFRGLRNQAAHQPIFKLQKEHLKNIKPKKFQNLDEFHSLCVDLIFRLWNSNINIITPVFAPTLSE